MSEPAWNDPELKSNAGTMVRCALWLKQVIGEGNTFTKQQVQSAFPGVTQADRRVRDLRSYGWVIHTNTQDATLSMEEQRLVRIGVPVWDKKARTAASKTKALSEKVRQETLANDGYMCRACGITGGESYPDDPVRSAVLSVANREVAQSDGTVATMPVTLCKRCLTGARGSRVRMDKALEIVDRLDSAQRSELAEWIRMDRRRWTDLERVWSAYCALPSEARAVVESKIEQP
ncbi:hypothetical protein [Glycomyces tarimensis]